jgi:hypothetical protein
MDKFVKEIGLYPSSTLTDIAGPLFAERCEELAAVRPKRRRIQRRLRAVVPQFDPQTATLEDLVQKATETRGPDLCFIIAERYFNGRGGAPIDMKHAHTWYLRAPNHRGAQLGVAKLYAQSLLPGAAVGMSASQLALRHLKDCGWPNRDALLEISKLEGSKSRHRGHRDGDGDSRSGYGSSYAGTGRDDSRRSGHRSDYHCGASETSQYQPSQHEIVDLSERPTNPNPRAPSHQGRRGWDRQLSYAATHQRQQVDPQRQYELEQQALRRQAAQEASQEAQAKALEAKNRRDELAKAKQAQLLQPRASMAADSLQPVPLGGERKLDSPRLVPGSSDGAPKRSLSLLGMTRIPKKLGVPPSRPTQKTPYEDAAGGRMREVAGDGGGQRGSSLKRPHDTDWGRSTEKKVPHRAAGNCMPEKKDAPALKRARDPMLDRMPAKSDSPDPSRPGKQKYKECTKPARQLDADHGVGAVLPHKKMKKEVRPIKSDKLTFSDENEAENAMCSGPTVAVPPEKKEKKAKPGRPKATPPEDPLQAELLRQFPYGCTVWAKVSTYPFWPGTVVDLAAVAEKSRKTLGTQLKSELRKPANKGVGFLLIEFFETGDYSWAKSNRILLFEDGPHTSGTTPYCLMPCCRI